MRRREFIKSTGAAIAAAWMGPFSVRAAAEARKARPNILVICSDEHHPAKLGYRGHDVVGTPNIDRIAAEGVHFTRAYCNSPICGPSRMSFMTGKYVHQLGTWLNGVRLDPAEVTWAQRLGRAGVRTSAYGKVGVVGRKDGGGFAEFHSRARHPVYVPWPFESPFDQRLVGFSQPPWWLVQDPGSREDGLRRLAAEGRLPTAEGLHPNAELVRTLGYFDLDREVTDRSLAFLRERGGSKSGEPWLHFVGYTLPHWPYVCPEKYLARYDPSDVDLPHDHRLPNDRLHPEVRHFQAARPFAMNEQKLRAIIATYYGMITCMDDMIGELLAELRKQGLYEDTYVIYLSDHGQALGEHGLFGKQTSYEASVGVPLAMRGPGLPPGKRVDDPVSLVDLDPTLLQMAGLEPGSERPGTSLLDRARGRSPPGSDLVFSEYHGGYFRNDWYLVVRDHLKYTHYADARPSLFDIGEDPGELADLATDPAHRGTVDELEQRLRAVLDPEATTLRAKRDCGLIGSSGEDYTRTLSWLELRRGRRSGKFGPRFRAVAEPEG